MSHPMTARGQIRPVDVSPLDELWTENEAAAFLKLSTRTLQAWRVGGGGPPFEKLGRAVRYSKRSVIEWRRQNTFASTSGLNSSAGGAA